MTLSTPAIYWIILVVFLAPLLVAIVHLKGAAIKGLIAALFLNARLLYARLTREELRLQRDYESKQLSLKTMRQSLIELSRREQEISKVAESLRTKAEALTRRAARKKGDERLVAKSVKHRERSAEIALQLEQHKIKVAEVRLKISVMEHALEVVDQRKKVLTEAIQRKDPLGSSRQFLRMHSARSRVGNIKSLSSMDDVSKRAVVVISELELQVAQKEAQAYGKISANGTTNTVAKRIEKYEKQIRQREIRAYERPPKPQKRTLCGGSETNRASRLRN